MRHFQDVTPPPSLVTAAAPPRRSEFNPATFFDDSFGSGSPGPAIATRRKRPLLNPFVGCSEAILRLRELAYKVASSGSPVLVLGETGSGKGVLANWLHANSPRGQGEFLDVNCAGLDREFLETELFGHQRGAFTSAVHEKPGLLEVANRGTLFLDEIGDIDLQVQPKLLKVLETGRFRRMGDVRDRYSDVRLISATHRDLRRRVQDGSFREDLYYRINIILLEVPALRGRREDVPALACQILQSIAAERQQLEAELDRSALRALMDYSWPGNIRELRNVLERAMLAGEGNVIRGRDLQFYPLCFSEQSDGLANLTLREMERTHITVILEQEQGSVQKAARRLGIPRSSLYNKLSRLGMVQARA